ncbi:MAG: ribosome-associated translation inhibitor RaiA [Myxococcales bacterium]|nr:ribosome-associated translation inhibitor RaiA [Myxococcales bacterium]MCB9734619.1 ribosome-associated translation inhibitor RaiA [Deltaproteobacteria bacterium]
MRINFTFRHMDASEAVKTHASGKLARLGRFEDREMAVDTTFSVEKFNKTAEFRVSGAHGTFLQTETREDLFEAIDVAVDKLDRQLSRSKSRRKHHKGLQAATPHE